MFERAASISDREVVLKRGASADSGAIRRTEVHEDDAIGIWIRQVANEDGVDDAEGERVGADPEGERHDRRRREHWSPAKLPQSVANVGGKIVEPHHTASLATALLPAKWIAELGSRPFDGVASREARGCERVGARLHMEVPLFFHLSFKLAAPDERRRERPEPGDQRHDHS